MNKPLIATHGLKHAEIGADGIERVNVLFLDEDGNYQIQLHTYWPDKLDGPMVTIINLTPAGIEFLQDLLNFGLDDILNFPMESND